MKQLKKGSYGNQVVFLQKLLQKDGHILPVSGTFDSVTDQAARQFQRKNCLKDDGIVGPRTWKLLLTELYDFNLGASNYLLDTNEWFNAYYEKDTIYLHHTAGGHRPDYTIDWWEKDNKPGELRRVGTAFVIGRESLNGNRDYNGKVYRAFNEVYWAHHLGLRRPNNKRLNQKSIGIEICAFGPLRFENSKFFFQAKNKKIFIPESQVCELDIPWRGTRYYHKYSVRQIEVCKNLILTLAFLFDIPIRQFTYTANWFNINQDALEGKPGLWTHCNVRQDKSDCFPQPEFIDMLNSLHESFKTFMPQGAALEALSHHSIRKNPINNSESDDYALDLEDL